MNDGPSLLPEFDQEMASTRTMLERVPDDRLDWRPHPKSYTLRDLAAHVSNLPRWTTITMDTSELDFEQQPDRDVPDSRDALLADFDEASAGARASLEAATAEDMTLPWTLRVGDHVIFTMPKGVVYRSFVMNHLIHHRAQLGVYLRLLDVPVPGMYGPSADDPAMTGG